MEENKQGKEAKEQSQEATEKDFETINDGTGDKNTNNTCG